MFRLPRVCAQMAIRHSSSASGRTRKFDRMIQELKIKPSIATVCFSGNLWEKLLSIHNAGFQGVELTPSDVAEIEYLPDIYDYCVDLDLKVTALQPFRDLGGWNCNEEFYAKIDELKKFFIIMNQLCTNMLIIGANTLPHPSDDMNIIVDQFRTASRLAANRGIKLAYESVSWATNVHTLEKLCEIVEKVDEPNFGICIDSFHINMHRPTIEKLNILKEKLFSVQLCDAPNLKLTDLAYFAKHYRVLPFQGNFPSLIEDLKVVHDTGYDGYLTLEIFNQTMVDSHKNRAVAEDAMRSLIYLQGSYSDRYLNTNYFPPVKVDAISLGHSYGSAGSIRLYDMKNLAIVTQQVDDLRTNMINMSYENRMDNQEIVLSNQAHSSSYITQAIVEVQDMFQYNRLVLFLRTCFKMDPIPHPLNRYNDINLPRTQAFGYESGGLTVVINVINYDLNSFN
ncbi:hypothetical protein DIURU_003761 [Diutina rugosa]|uniref:Xylose isomerase-like TIM barrel domain-containing protein n=1 Tax=Diutina rugosa TaxID=5481 RepID=A0A642UK27_DIURU|nr:uncharacterized protein DIURU_003761 [Diutina rugosa]KAA8900525.1 hypothetical protein DIURU_003761 [Diutina rugosa]